ncbi:hypothetical protein [uncultured Thermanaerothrix sp.]|uniref:CCA tRNA nucleotidyltransferase n=1 Tax=uncultured Thermanaerothrix sp. TaxID=1195149 RepID=UPI002625FC71|nr:hypothetical protein [uncultured Thermanaerothrix sp.]
MLIVFENLFPIPTLYPLLRRLSHTNRRIFLVGGALRDALLGKSSHDLDFAVSHEVHTVARTVADALGAALYIMDEEHETYRVLGRNKSGQPYTLDFSRLRGLRIEQDLRARDFTINAMAVDVSQPNVLIDPLKGSHDLREKRLRACSESAFVDDPLRVVRGIRLANALKFHLLPETVTQLRQAVPLLDRVSAERKRDELFRMLEGEDIKTAFQLMDRLGILPYLLPELPLLKGVPQPSPHVFDVWEHTLATLDYLERLFALLVADYNEDKTASLVMGSTTLYLGRFRTQLISHYSTRLNPNRSLRALLFLAAAYHDSGKPESAGAHPNGRLSFIGHERISQTYFEERARALALSNDEIEHGVKVVRHHMRIHHLANAREGLSRRATYRFFRDVGMAGIDICLLSLADTLATYHTTLPQEIWKQELAVCQQLMEAWWHQQDSTIHPPALLRGNDLMAVLGLSPSPLIGRLLEAIREAQASGEINTREEALRLAQDLLAAWKESALNGGQS